MVEQRYKERWEHMMRMVLSGAWTHAWRVTNTPRYADELAAIERCRRAADLHGMEAGFDRLWGQCEEVHDGMGA
jgi:hypothetical protein